MAFPVEEPQRCTGTEGAYYPYYHCHDHYSSYYYKALHLNACYVKWYISMLSVHG